MTNNTTHDEAIQGTLQRRLDHQSIAVRLCRQAKKEICLFTYDLEAAIYDSQEIIDILRRFCLRHRQSQIRILVKESQLAIQKGHRLIELSRSLTTSIHIHKPAKDTPMIDSNYLLIDAEAYLFKPAASQWHGVYHFQDPARAREFHKHFNAAWDRSQVDPEARRLHI